LGRKNGNGIRRSGKGSLGETPGVVISFVWEVRGDASKRVTRKRKADPSMTAFFVWEVRQ